MKLRLQNFAVAARNLRVTAAITLVIAQTFVLRRFLYLLCGHIFTLSATWWIGGCLTAFLAGMAFRKINPTKNGIIWLSATAALIIGSFVLIPFFLIKWLSPFWLRHLMLTFTNAYKHNFALILLVMGIGILPFASTGVLFETLFRSKYWLQVKGPNIYALILQFIIIGSLLPHTLTIITLDTFALLVVCLAILLAAMLFWLKQKWLAIILPFVAIAMFLWLPDFLPSSIGVAQPRWAYRDTGFLAGEKVVQNLDTPRASITLNEHDDYGKIITKDGYPLSFQSRFRASTVLPPHLAILLHPRAQRIAVVGPQASIMLPHVKLHSLEQIDCATDLPQLAKWEADIMPPQNNAAVTNNPAVHMASAEAASIIKSKIAYDIVLATSSPGWTTGSARWLDKTQMQKYADMLAPDGLAALTIDTRGMTPKLFQRSLSTFAACFNHTQLWCFGLNNWMIVGSQKPIKVPVDLMLQRFEQSPVFRDLASAGIYALPDLLACYVLDTEGIREIAAKYKPAGKFMLATALVLNGPATLYKYDNRGQLLVAIEPFRSWQLDWLLPGEMDPELFVFINKRVTNYLQARSRIAVVFSDPVCDGINLAAALRDIEPPKHDTLIREQVERLELLARRLLVFGGNARAAANYYEVLTALQPDSAPLHYGLALANQRSGENQSAYWHFAHATSLAEKSIAYRMELALTATQVGELTEAARQYREILKLEPANAMALYRLARVIAMPKYHKRNITEAVRLAEQACALSKWSDYDMAIGLADLYIESGRAVDGVMLKRRLRNMRPKTTE